MIIRQDIEEKLLSVLSWSPAVALLGPRQVGKTTLARYLQTKLKKPTLYVDLDVVATT